MSRFQQARPRPAHDGFTLVEVTIIVLVLVILSMIMLPQLGNFNRLARKVYATEDVAALCATLEKFLDEVMLPGPFFVPGGGTQAATSRIGLLAGPGSAPALAAGAPVDPAPDVSTGNWNLDCPNEPPTFKVTPDIVTTTPAVETLFGCDLFENHLQINNPGGGGPFDPGDLATDRYQNPSELTSVSAFLGWRGPYFNQINSDPWGTRYMSNPFGLHSDSNGNTFSTPVVCISFGPNALAETSINMEHPRGYSVGGDDITVVLSAMGPF